MKLSKLIDGLDCKVIGSKDIEINDIVIESNLVSSGSMFICIKGKDFDSHNLVKQVEIYGAKAVVTDHFIPSDITQIIVKDTRIALSYLSAAFYDNIYKKMDIIAVVGTNGKTSTCHIIKKVYDYIGGKCGLIGTSGIYYNDKYIDAKLTTPDPLDFHKILYDMYVSGIRIVVMEVSAHAIYLNKLKGIEFVAGVFTNFSQDHLDFFETMEKYKDAKLKFFRENNCKYIITNSDDIVGREIMKLRSDTITYGINNPADVFAINIVENQKGSQFVINLFDLVFDVNVNLLGKFNVYNILAAATTLCLMGVEPDNVVKGVEQVDCVKGRLERIVNDEYSVYVDYAHTPDGLENSLNAIRKIANKRLICLFGCGGNRDKLKRNQMGEISGKLADFTIITSDNPRFEEPMDIINMIEEGVCSVTKKYVSIEDRADAIKYALKMLKKGDVLLIAGKGDEKYQEVLGIKKPYNDKDTVREILRG